MIEIFAIQVWHQHKLPLISKLRYFALRPLSTIFCRNKFLGQHVEIFQAGFLEKFAFSLSGKKVHSDKIHYIRIIQNLSGVCK